MELSNKKSDTLCCLSRRSQPPLALAVPLARLASQVGGGPALYGSCTQTSESPALRKMIQKPPVKEDPLPRFPRPLGVLTRPHWTPEPDEKRFLVGLPITLVVIQILWKRGWGDPLGGYSSPASFAFWSAAYVIRFRQRLKDRGELKRVIIAPAVFVALLQGFDFYARW